MKATTLAKLYALHVAAWLGSDRASRALDRIFTTAMYEEGMRILAAKDGAAHDLAIDYTNHRGERRIRRILPRAIRHNPPTAVYHPNQWVIAALDLDTCENRDFALAYIHRWIMPQTKADKTP